MEIVTVDSVTVRTVNPHIADVKALVKATKDYKGKEGTAPAGKFVVANKDVQKTIFYIQQVAMEEGFTARIASPQRNGLNSKGNAVRVPISQVDAKGVETGKTELLFKIMPKRKENGRKPRNTDASEASDK